MEYTGPIVSVIIPTFKRPHLVKRAVRSALSQTLSAIEVIVVVDGPDDETFEELNQFEDSRLRVNVLPRNVGSGGARNVGIKEARGEWVAFLDDDDEWFPQKLEIQLRAAQKSRHIYPIISCRLIARRNGVDFILPRRFPNPNEPISEYLFCRRSLFWGEGLVQTSTILTKKELLQNHPFSESIKRHEDLDWVLRATNAEDVEVEFAPRSEPLVIWHIEDNRRRIGNTPDWRYSLSWVKANKHLFTSRAYTSFIMTWVSEKAVQEGDINAFFHLLGESCRQVKPTACDVLVFSANWLIPQSVKRRLAAIFAKGHLNSLLSRYSDK